MRKRNIYTLKMAQALINQGFKPIAQVPSAKDLTRDIWVFEETEDFKRAFDNYLENNGFHVIKPENSKTPKFSQRLITRMHLKQGLPVSAIASITGRSEEQIQRSIDNQIGLYQGFALAQMNKDELAAYAAIQDKEERAQMALDFLRKNKFPVYGGRDSYVFPDELVETEGGE